jgi:hypothetical protein
MLGELVKAVLERALEAELTAHLGYERHERAGHRTGNAAQDIPQPAQIHESGNIRSLPTGRRDETQQVIQQTAWYESGHVVVTGRSRPVVPFAGACLARASSASSGSGRCGAGDSGVPVATQEVPHRGHQEPR